MSALFSKLVLLGDSLTQFAFSNGGWGARIADHFQRRLDVINRGFSGYNSTWINLALPSIFAALGDVNAVTVFLGANDASLPSNQRQHVPLDKYKSNLAAIVQQLLNMGLPNDHVLLITPPPLIEKAWKEFSASEGREMDRDAKVTATYATAAKEVATAMGVRSIDLFQALRLVAEEDHVGFEECFVDGLHLSPKGNEILAQTLIPVLEEVFSKGADEVLPDWKEVDYTNPAESFNKT